MTEVTLTELRRDIFRLVDQALDSGEPIVFRRKGRRVVVRPEPEERPLTHQERFDLWLARNGPTYEDLTPEERATVDAEIAAEQAEHRVFQAEQEAEWLAEWDEFYRMEAAGEVGLIKPKDRA